MSSKTSAVTRTHYWQEQVAAWKASGKSQITFCRVNHLNYGQFGYWVRKFHGQSIERMAHTPSKSGFVPVTPSPSAAMQGLSVLLPNGLAIQGICAENLACAQQLLRQLS